MDMILASLTCRDGTPPLLPNLTSINIFTPMYEEKDPLLYDNFKKSRATRRQIYGVEVSALCSA